MPFGYKVAQDTLKNSLFCEALEYRVLIFKI
jgi:hypothetical protein